jgi:hypothetical protein
MQTEVNVKRTKTAWDLAEETKALSTAINQAVEDG